MCLNPKLQGEKMLLRCQPNTITKSQTNILGTSCWDIIPSERAIQLWQKNVCIGQVCTQWCDFIPLETENLVLNSSQGGIIWVGSFKIYLVYQIKRRQHCDFMESNLVNSLPDSVLQRGLLIYCLQMSLQASFTIATYGIWKKSWCRNLEL